MNARTRLPARRTLSFVGSDGAFTRTLPEIGRLLIGRAPECEIALSDATVALKHAVLTIEPASVEITDLGSPLGTVLGSRRLEDRQSASLTEGIPVTLGSTVFTLQRARSSARPRRLLTHGYFEARVDEECARASRGGAAFAIVRVRSTVSGRADEVAELLSSWTRSLDVIGVYAPGRFEVFLAQTDEGRAEAIGREIALAFKQQKLDVVVEVCCFPRDGRTTDVLVDRGPFRDSPKEGTFEETEPPSAMRQAFGGFMARMEPMVERVASSDISVLILGETGVGKEILARRLHTLSPRAKKPLVAINCSAISESLLESELFGHEKGAFTGAVQTKLGLLESAEGGTVFLDEIGEMSVLLQAKLLRVLEQREITRVGSLKTRPIDVRFVSATHRDLESESAHGRFRQDLYFRLNGITLSIPPLRERTDEVAELVQTFVADVARRLGKKPRGITSKALALLEAYPWPGNVRELRNMIERAVLLSDGGTIAPEHLPTEKMQAVIPPDVPRHSLSVHGVEIHAPVASAPSLPVASSEAVSVAPKPRPGGPEERLHIIAALDRCGGNQTAAAKVLGISRRTLVTRLASHDLPRPRKRGT